MAWKSTSGRGTTGKGQRLMKTITDGDIDGDDFGLVAEPFRRELVAYGYRMLGSVDDAEEIVQDVYLEAWRAYERFEARSSVRTWLYRIATRAFVKAVARRNRRPLPSDLSAPAANPGVAISRGVTRNHVAAARSRFAARRHLGRSGRGGGGARDDAVGLRCGDAGSSPAPAGGAHSA